MKLENVRHLFVLLLSTTIGGSAATFHADRGSFEAQVGSVTNITFDGLVGTSQFPSNYPNVCCGWYGGAATVAGVRFQAPSPDLIYILSSDINTNKFSIDGYTLSGGRTKTTVTFPPGKGGFGADLKFDDYWFRWPGENIWSPTVTAIVRFVDGSSETNSFEVPDRRFWGVSGKEISQIEFNSGGPNAPGAYTPYLMFDNVAVWHLPDIVALDLKLYHPHAGTNAGVRWTYLFTNGPANVSALSSYAGVYWADWPNGPHRQKVDDNLILTALANYSNEITFPPEKFTNPPDWATHVLFWVDPDNNILESNEANNVKAIKFPWVKLQQLGNQRVRVSWNALSIRIEAADSLNGPWSPAFVGESSPVIIDTAAERKYYRSLTSSD